MGGGGKKPVKTSTGKIIMKRRMGIRIDMTPMVDIVFLLLIFYMVTTVFAMPQAMEVNLPDKEEIETEIDYAESRVFIVRVDQEGELWRNIGRKIPSQIPFDSLRANLVRENQKENKLATIVTIHPKAKYYALVDILDEIDVVERGFRSGNFLFAGNVLDTAFSYRFTMKPWDDEDDRAVNKALERLDSEG